MAIDQFKKDLLSVAQNARDLASSLGAVGDTVTVLEVTVSALSVIFQVKSIMSTRTSSASSQASDIISTGAKKTPRQAVSYRNESNF